ncbi:MAG: hypothetical protein IKP88_02380 [Lachnospiraceae bacterium]|nr:hypothetical protein [Lachnospiraceae bacterium]
MIKRFLLVMLAIIFVLSGCSEQKPDVNEQPTADNVGEKTEDTGNPYPEETEGNDKEKENVTSTPDKEYISPEDVFDNELKPGQVIELGHYEQDNDLTNGNEPIEWIVIRIDENNRAFLLSRYALDYMEYNRIELEKNNKISWKDCTIRQWLNRFFYQTAFSEEEKKMIIETDEHENVKDRVFLASADELMNPEVGFGVDPLESDTLIMCIPTKYAIAKGAEEKEGKLFYGVPTTKYWTRSIKDDEKPILIKGNKTETDKITGDYNAVRPMVCIDANAYSSWRSNVKYGASINNVRFDLMNAKPRDFITLGKFEQDNDLSNGKEPIKWVVLSRDNDELYIMSEFCLDFLPFDSREMNNTTLGVSNLWINSSIREWLNNEFYKTSFSPSEQDLIAVTTLNIENEEANTVQTSEDKVFLLSLDDSKKEEYGFHRDKNLICKLTDYAFTKVDKTGIVETDEEKAKICHWWLCNSAYDSNDYIIDYLGNQTERFWWTANGVRPVMRLNIGKYNEYLGRSEPVKSSDGYSYVYGGLTVKIGTFEQDNDLSNGSESIEWVVLNVDEENGRALLLSKYGLDCRKFNETHDDVTWEDSSLRKWLNSDFYNVAFDEKEKSYILDSEIISGDNSENGTSDGNVTKDKVFLLSVDEVTDIRNGFISRPVKEDDNRKRGVSLYAKMKGALTSERIPSDWEQGPYTEGGPAGWWLRTRSGKGVVSYVDDEGYVVGEKEGKFVDRDTIAVVPAIYISIK